MERLLPGRGLEEVADAASGPLESVAVSVDSEGGSLVMRRENQMAAPMTSNEPRTNSQTPGLTPPRPVLGCVCFKPVVIKDALSSAKWLRVLS